MILQRQLLDCIGILSDGARLLGVSLTEIQAAQMVRHLEAIEAWRDRIRVTSLKNVREIAIIHFLDSLTVCKVLPELADLRMLDIGTGGGFPGLVVKVARESVNLTLLDRNPRKIVFLKHVARDLELARIDFFDVPWERLLSKPPSPIFDVVVSRALFSDVAFVDRLAPLVVPGGSLIRMAGPASSERMVESQSFQEAQVWEGTLPFSDVFRRVYRYVRI